MRCSVSRTIVIPGETEFPKFPSSTRFYVTDASARKIRNLKLLIPSRRRSMAIRLPQRFNCAATPSLILTSGASGRVNALFSIRPWLRLLAIVNAVLLILILPFRERNRSRKDGESGGRKGSVLLVRAAMLPWRNRVAEQEVSMRRSLAIGRLMQDKDVETIREDSLFDTARGDTLFTQSWTPVSVKVRGLVVLLHGLNEHSGRYTTFAKQLNANGFKVYGMDWIGHGGSDGLHAYVHSLDDAVADMKSFVDKVLADNPGLPCFCFGHSTGAAIILKATLDPKVQAQIAGVVLTSPAVGVQPSHPIIVLIAPVISVLLPRFQLSAANRRGTPVSRDPDALEAKYSDPLVYTGAIRVRTGYEILRITSYLQQNLERMRVPFLLLHGTADTVTDPKASQKLYDEASSSDKTIKLYEGFLHDLLFELEHEPVVDDILDWLNCRL